MSLSLPFQPARSLPSLQLLSRLPSGIRPSCPSFRFDQELTFALRLGFSLFSVKRGKTSECKLEITVKEPASFVPLSRIYASHLRFCDAFFFLQPIPRELETSTHVQKLCLLLRLQKFSPNSSSSSIPTRRPSTIHNSNDRQPKPSTLHPRAPFHQLCHSVSFAQVGRSTWISPGSDRRCWSSRADHWRRSFRRRVG